MKNIKIATLLSLLFFSITYACGQQVSIITGNWVEKTEKINLYKVDNGKLVEIASSTLENTKFGFAINGAKEGFYVIGDTPLQPAQNYTFYIKPGDKLNVEIDRESFDYKLLGDNNTGENKEMKRWFDLFKSTEYIAIHFKGMIKSYVDFFPMFEESLKQEKAFALQENVSKEFEPKFAKFRQVQLLNAALKVLYTPRATHPKKEEYIDYYKTIDFKETTSSDILLEYPYGLQVLNTLSLFKENYPVANKGGLSAAEKLRKNLALIGNDVLKGESLVSQIQRITQYESLLKFNEEFGKYLITDYQKKVLKDQMVKLVKIDSGVTAIDFKFKDKRGKEVALSDFKGKVVYIDIWATWCGPCLKEAPHWKTLSDKYKRKDIVFLGVSIDKEKDHQKWVDYLDKEGEVGVQIFGGDNSGDIMKPYEIRTIPHLLLIGKDGKIISPKAPRPSSDEITILLDKALGI